MGIVNPDGSNSPVASSVFPVSLNGSYGSFLDNARVVFTPTKAVYVVKTSFFLLNSETSYIICYVLENVETGLLFVCPSVYLTLEAAKPSEPNSPPNGEIQV